VKVSVTHTTSQTSSRYQIYYTTEILNHTCNEVTLNHSNNSDGYAIIKINQEMLKIIIHLILKYYHSSRQVIIFTWFRPKSIFIPSRSLYLLFVLTEILTQTQSYSESEGMKIDLGLNQVNIITCLDEW
jgi:hypothetical protein